MPRKKKVKKFRAVEAVKALARERIGAPQAGRVIPDKKRETRAKHKPKLEDLVQES